MALYGFTIQCYIDIRIVASVLKYWNINGFNMPRNLSEAVRTVFTTYAEAKVPDGLRIETRHEAIELLESLGYKTKQNSPNRRRSLANSLAEEDMAEVDTNPIIGVPEDIKKMFKDD